MGLGVARCAPYSSLQNCPRFHPRPPARGCIGVPVPVRTRPWTRRSRGPRSAHRRSSVSFPHSRAMAIALFPSRNPITEATGCLRRNRDAHVHMVRHQVSLQNLAFLLFRQRMENRAQLPADIARRSLSVAVWARILRDTCSPIWNGLGSDKRLTLTSSLCRSHQATWGGFYIGKTPGTVKPFQVSLVEPVACSFESAQPLAGNSWPPKRRLRGTHVPGPHSRYGAANPGPCVSQMDPRLTSKLFPRLSMLAQGA